MRSRRHTATLSLLATLLLCAPAHAWTKAELVSPLDEVTSTYPTLGVDPAGNVTLVYSRTATRNDVNSYRLYESTRAAGAGWTQNDNPISNAGVTSFMGDDDEFALGISPAGDGRMAFRRIIGSSQLWTINRAAFGSPWGNETQLSGAYSCPPGGSDTLPNDPAVVWGNATTGHVLWGATCSSASSGSTNQYPILARPFSNTGLAPLVSAGGGRVLVGPEAAALPDGRTRFIYNRQVDGMATGRLTAETLDGANLVPSERTESFSPQPNSATGPRLGVFPDGKEVAVWRNSSTTPPSVSGRFSGGDSVQLSPPGQDTYGHDVAVGDDGTAVVAWFASLPGDDQLWAVVKPPNEPFGPPHELSDVVPGLKDLNLGVSPNGVAYAAWIRNDGELDMIEAARMDPLDPAVSPGAPFQFQPTPVELTADREGVLGPTKLYGTAQRLSLVVSDQNVAHAAASVVHDVLSPPVRFAIVTFRHVGRAPGEAPPATVTPTPTPTVTPTGSPPAGPPPSTDRTPPGIGPISLSRVLFGAGKEGKTLVKPGGSTIAQKKLAKRGEPLKAGTKIRFTLTEAAAVKIVLRHVGCYGRTTLTDGEGKDKADREEREREVFCNPKKLDGVVGTLTKAGRVGGNALIFDGRGTRKKLRPASAYSLTFEATDAAGNEARKSGPVIKFDAPL